MRRLLATAVFIGIGLAGVQAEIGQTALLVKVSGFDGSDAYRVMSTAEYKVLEKRVRDENRFLRKALENAKKAWEADKNHEKVPFPSSAVQGRKLRMTGRYKNREEAEEKLRVYDERLSQAEAKDQEKERERAHRTLSRVRNKQSRDRMMEKLKEEERENEEKLAIRSLATELFEAELEKLIVPADPAGQPGAGTP